jgi:hypothetical protein
MYFTTGRPAIGSSNIPYGRRRRRQPAEQDIGKYHVVRTTYAYLAHARTGNGAYWIRAARYTLTVSGSDEVISSTHGAAEMARPTLTCIFSTRRHNPRCRGGGALFTYALSPKPGARRPVDDPASQIGMLTTNAATTQIALVYWLDADGGSDMGGLTYYFHTAGRPRSPAHWVPASRRIPHQVHADGDVDVGRIPVAAGGL